MKNSKQYLFDNPQNIKRTLYLLFAICTFLLGMDLVIHRHVSHSWENLWGFYPLFGFVACVTLVLVAKWMRKFLMRPENYYDRDELKNIDDGGNND